MLLAGFKLCFGDAFVFIRMLNNYLNNQSWGWELHPMHVEISPSKLFFLIKAVFLNAQP